MADASTCPPSGLLPPHGGPRNQVTGASASDRPGVDSCVRPLLCVVACAVAGCGARTDLDIGDPGTSSVVDRDAGADAGPIEPCRIVDTPECTWRVGASVALGESASYVSFDAAASCHLGRVVVVRRQDSETTEVAYVLDTTAEPPSIVATTPSEWPPGFEGRSLIGGVDGWVEVIDTRPGCVLRFRDPDFVLRSTERVEDAQACAAGRVGLDEIGLLLWRAPDRIDVASVSMRARSRPVVRATLTEPLTAGSASVHPLVSGDWAITGIRGGGSWTGPAVLSVLGVADGRIRTTTIAPSSNWLDVASTVLPGADTLVIYTDSILDPDPGEPHVDLYRIAGDSIEVSRLFNIFSTAHGGGPVGLTTSAAELWISPPNPWGFHRPLADGEELVTIAPEEGGYLESFVFDEGTALGGQVWIEATSSASRFRLHYRGVRCVD